MTAILGSPGTRFGVLSGGVSRIYDRDCGVLGRRSGPRFDAVAPHMLAFRGVWESSGRCFRLSQQRTLPVDSAPSRCTADQLGAWVNPTPTYLPEHSHLIGWQLHLCVCVCVLGGGGVPTYRQCSIAGDHIGPAHTHGAKKTCFIIEIDVFWGADRSPTDRTDSLISGISGAQKRRQKDRKITDPLDSR